jgi:uncharacterized protein YndB with AHSA1/START domain
MKKYILIALGVVVALVALLAIVVATQPSSFKVERTATIAAPAATVFEQVNDFHLWENWSPWAKLDPNMETTFDGEAEGKGAEYSWKGNADVGEGKMTIVESEAPEHIQIKLEFLAPFAATNITDFHFDEEDEKTTVTWSMSGERDFMTKAICLVMDMDAMIGGDFEKGLAKLKEEAEEVSGE